MRFGALRTIHNRAVLMHHKPRETLVEFGDACGPVLELQLIC